MPRCRSSNAEVSTFLAACAPSAKMTKQAAELLVTRFCTVGVHRGLALLALRRCCKGTVRMPRRAERRRESSPPATRRVLPIELQIGDRLTDEAGEYEIIGRPFATNAGKDVHARVKKVDQPDSPRCEPGPRTSASA